MPSSSWSAAEDRSGAGASERDVPVPTVAVDGRSARRLRNTDAAVDAILELLDEGCTAPTAQLVAERSGLSIRSIFRLFQDMDELHSTAIARQQARLAPLFHDVPSGGPLAARIRALVQTRAELYEAISPVRRHALRVAPGSPQIQAGLARVNAHFREQLQEIFEPELAATPEPERPGGADPEPAGRITTLAALEAVTSWELWERLRTVQANTVDAASAAVTLLVSAALHAAPAPAAVERSGGAALRPTPST